MYYVRLFVIASAVSLCLAAGVDAGQIYDFDHIADTTVRAAPAINNNGVVAFVEGNSGQSPGVVETFSGGITTVIGNGQGSVYGVWINNSAQVAFRNSPSAGTFNAVRGSGGPLTVIGSEIGDLPVIDDSGNVTFAQGTTSILGAFTTYGIVTGNGGALTTVMPTAATSGIQYASEFEGYAVSHNGIVVYEQYPSSSAQAGQQIFTFQNGVRKSIVTLANNPGEAGVNSLAVNNSGVVAIAGALDFDNAGIYLGDGTIFTQAITSTAEFEAGSAPASINNLGQFAFQGNYSPTGFTFDGIYTGQDPLQDKVIQTGDALGGSTVTALTFGNDALNDNGQVVFWAQLANGTSGIYVGTPVPEPSTAMLMLVAGGGLFSSRARKRVSRVHRLTTSLGEVVCQK